MANVTRYERLKCKLKHWYAHRWVSRVLPPRKQCLTCGADRHFSLQPGPYFCCRDCHIEWGYYIGKNTFDHPDPTSDPDDHAPITEHYQQRFDVESENDS